MVQIQVTKVFYDKDNLSHQYCVGEVVLFDENRANDIVARGLGVFLNEEKVEETEPEKEEVKTAEPTMFEETETLSKAEEEMPKAETEKPARRGRRSQSAE